MSELRDVSDAIRARHHADACIRAALDAPTERERVTMLEAALNVSRPLATREYQQHIASRSPR